MFVDVPLSSCYAIHLKCHQNTHERNLFWAEIEKEKVGPDSFLSCSCCQANTQSAVKMSQHRGTPSFLPRRFEKLPKRLLHQKYSIWEDMFNIVALETGSLLNILKANWPIIYHHTVQWNDLPCSRTVPNRWTHIWFHTVQDISGLRSDIYPTYYAVSVILYDGRYMVQIDSNIGCNNIRCISKVQHWWTNLIRAVVYYTNFKLHLCQLGG